MKETFELLENKNHDYGEAWREMRVSSITDIILMKLLRVKQIEDNQGKTLVSEGVKANYQDMINYAVFCLIKLKINKVLTEFVVSVMQKVIDQFSRFLLVDFSFFRIDQDQ